MTYYKVYKLTLPVGTLAATLPFKAKVQLISISADIEIRINADTEDWIPISATDMRTAKLLEEFPISKIWIKTTAPTTVNAVVWQWRSGK